ncbi:MAG: DUF3566 domain-containing protein [Actinomycetota bacterium]|jgi:hypothetical protein
MRAVVETEAAARRGEERTAARRTRVVIRRVDPWSVLKFSLLFYFCLMLVFLFALLILYWLLGVTGVLDSAARVLSDVGFGGTAGFEFHGYWIFSRLFLIGVAGVVVWSLVNVLISILYNLISDVVGGIQVTLGEKR